MKRLATAVAVGVLSVGVPTSVVSATVPDDDDVEVVDDEEDDDGASGLWGLVGLLGLAGLAGLLKRPDTTRTIYADTTPRTPGTGIVP